MPSNPAVSFEPQSKRARLAAWEVLEVAGIDASAFLQRQTMNDISLLTDSAPARWNGLLNAKGRVQAMFICLRQDDQRFWLIAPDLAAGALKDLLQKFVFRSKVTLKVRDDLGAFGSWKPQARETNWLSMPCELAAADHVTIELPGATGARTLKLCVPSSEEDSVDSEADQRWRLDDLRCGLPRLSADQMDAWTPHMLGLDRLSAFSLKKGCYPGQEIVARTHYLGRSKRSLLLLDASIPIKLGTIVHDAEGSPIGNTICNASWHEHHTVLAVCTNSLALQPWQTDAGVLLFPSDFAAG